MSLINQMLQDLDARRSDVTGTGTLGSQVRVVAKRGRAGIAWWMVAALVVTLLGVVVWLGLRPAAHTANALPQSPIKTVTVNGAVAQEKKGAVPQAPVVKQVDAIEKSDKRSLDLASKSIDQSEASVASITIPDTSRETIVPKHVDALDKATQSPKSLPLPLTPSPEPSPEPSPARGKSHAIIADRSDRLPAASVAPKIVEPTIPLAFTRQPKEQSAQQRADNEYRRALLSRQQGKQFETITTLEQALQLDPQHAAARQVLVGVLIEGGRQDDALKKAREGLDIDPAQPALAMIASRLQLEKGNLRPAIDTLERSLRYAIDRADYQAYLAALLQRDDRNKESIEHYLVALQQSPQTGVWWMGLGISLQAENRMQEALEAFNRAKASNSLSPELLAFVESKLTLLKR